MWARYVQSDTEVLHEVLSCGFCLSGARRAWIVNLNVSLRDCIHGHLRSIKPSLPLLQRYIPYSPKAFTAFATPLVCRCFFACAPLRPSGAGSTASLLRQRNWSAEHFPWTQHVAWTRYLTGLDVRPDFRFLLRFLIIGLPS